MKRLVQLTASVLMIVASMSFASISAQGQTCNPNDATASSGYCAPAPTCASGAFTWQQTVNPTYPPNTPNRLLSGSLNSFDIPSSTFPTAFGSGVTVTITDVVSYDGYSSRGSVTQTNERWRLVFKKNGSTVYASPYTNDVPDQQKQGYWRGALNTGVWISGGFDQITVEHIDVAQGYGGSAGSVIPTSVCISYSTTPPVCNPNDATASSGFCAPAPNCASGAFSWQQTIDPINPTASATRMISGSTNTVTIPSSGFPSAFSSAVTIDIDDVVAYDGYSSRGSVSQSNERFRLVFKKAGTILYTSPYTNDVPDNQVQGFWRGALSSGIYFANGFDEIIAEHYDVENGYNGPGSVIPSSVCISYSTAPTSSTVVCERTVGNTRGCSSTPYTIWLVDNTNTAHRLTSSDTANDYSFIEYADGTARFIGNDMTASTLSGTFDVDLVFSGKTTTPPFDSPKTSNCFTTGSTGGWEYYENTTGTITASSSTYGTMTVGRQGAAFQVGNNANITQSGLGGSGWLSISGGTGVITHGDINVMLSGCAGECTEKYATNVESSAGKLLHTGNTTTGQCDGSGVKFWAGNTGISTQMTWDMGEILPVGTEVCITVKLEHCSNVTGSTQARIRFCQKDMSAGTFSAVGADHYTSNTTYHQFCRTLTKATRYVMIEDMGQCAFRVDCLEWEECDESENIIKGFVFYDADVSGTKNGGDNGFGGVTVYLYEDTDGDGILDPSESTPIDSVVTNADGSYEFSVDYSGGTDNFLMGTNPTDYPAGTNLTTDNLESATFTGGGQTDDGNDYGYIDPNEIQGTVFFDENGDGVIQTSELGTAGNVVYLYEDTDGDGIIDPSEQTPIDSATTDANGEYTFTVEYTGGTNDFIVGLDSISLPGGNVITTPTTSTVSFTSGGNTDPDNDFGFDLANTIEGTVFVDYNKDGDQDAGEPGKPGITVYLFEDKNGNGTLDPFEKASPADSVNTDANGDYAFTVPYALGATEGFFTGTDLGDYSPSATLTTDNEEDATFTSGGNNDPNNDFGFSETNTIQGTVYNDYDGDAQEDGSEPGEAGVTVYLYEDANNDGVLDPSEQVPVDSVVTDANGDYEFIVDYTGGTNSFITATDLGDLPAGSSLTTDNLEVASFTSGDNVDPDNDFGFNEENRIEGTVFYDFNKDGNEDAGDVGEPGVKVYLYDDANNNGVIDASESTPIATATTDANGDYFFNVPYTGGTNSFITASELNDYPTSATQTTDNIEVASFTSGGNTDPDNDFGFSEVNTITGVVYYDSDVDATLDAGEPRRQGTTVYLYEDANNDGVLDPSEQTPIATAITDVNGEYTFTVDYTGGTNSFIVDTDPTTYPALTSLTTDNLEVASFTSGGNNDPNNNFGYIDNNRITGTVFEDSDSDGFYDPLEDGTFDILVLLYDDANNNSTLDAGETLLDSVRTDANGNYEFEVPYTGGTNSFVVVTDTNTYPSNADLTTDNIETASFTSGGNVDPNNNFGHDGCSTNAGLSAPTSGCADEDQLFVVNPAPSGATFAWTFSGPATPTTSSNASQLVNWATQGVYNAELIVTIPGCIDTFLHTINVTRAVSADASNNDTVCQGGSTVLDGSGSATGANYVWTVESGDPFSIDIGGTTTMPTVSPFVTTVYRLTVTDQINNCTKVDFVTVEVDVNLNPIADIDDIDPVCVGDDIDLDGTGTLPPPSNPGATLYYFWYQDGATLASFTDQTTATILDSSDISLVVFDAATLCSDTADVLVDPIEQPVVTSATVDPTCQLDNGQIILTITDDPNQSTVEFSIDGGVTYPYTSADNAGTFTISNLAEGTYDIFARWATDGCEEDFGSETLTDNTEIPTVSAEAALNGAAYMAADTVFIEGLDMLDLNANSNNSGTYTWTADNGTTGSTQAINATTAATYADSGYYYVEYVNLDGCPVTDSIFVDVQLFNVITGTVYKDPNADSDKQVGEPGEANVTVYLYDDANGNGVVDPAETTPVDSVDTDVNGDYDFKVPYFSGTDNFLLGTDRGDFPMGINFTEESDNLDEATFNAGNLIDAGNDFGFVPSMSIGSTIFEDTDKDGVFNNGESGISGVTVQVFEDADADGTPDSNVPAGTDVTDASGNYFVGDLKPGTYVVVLPTSNFATGGALETTPTSSAGFGGDDATDDDDNGDQATSGAIVTSSPIILAEGSEPTSETGQGSGQEATNGGLDNNGDMTVDFGFLCDSDIELAITSDKLLIFSETDPSTFTFHVDNTGQEDLSNVNLTAWFTYNSSTATNALSAPVYVSGDANNDGVINGNESWTYELTNQTFTFNRGDRITVFANITADGCETVDAAADVPVRTFGTNVDIRMPDDCLVPGDTIPVTLITRLLIDEDFEKAPTDAAGNPLPRVRYNATLNSLTLSGVNGGLAFDPFNPPAGVDITAFNVQGADSSRTNPTSPILDECEPINSIRTPFTGNQDVNGEFPDWEFVVNVVVPATIDTQFLQTAGDNFDVELLLESSANSGSFSPVDTLVGLTATDADSTERCLQDFGDAPDTYGTLVGSNGANHIITPDLVIGTSVLDELTGNPNGSDGDDDGITSVTPYSFEVGDTTDVDVTVLNNTGAPAFLSVMVDVDDNGTFDSDEIFEVTVPSNPIPQTATVPVITPADAVQSTDIWMRVRLTSTPNIGADGNAPDGEVEDYKEQVAVPVELISLNAEVKGSDVLVTWSTATEINNDYFEVQRRYEHQTEFTSIGSPVEGQGTTNTITDYDFVDENVKWLSPVIYYRLKQVDFDGTTTYTYHVPVTKSLEVDAEIYPNPAQNIATVAVINDGKEMASIRMFDMFGKDLTSDLTINNLGGAFEIDLNSLRNGTYFVEVVVGSEKVVKRLTVAR